jgi:hypothetical protein
MKQIKNFNFIKSMNKNVGLKEKNFSEEERNRFFQEKKPFFESSKPPYSAVLKELLKRYKFYFFISLTCSILFQIFSHNFSDSLFSVTSSNSDCFEIDISFLSYFFRKKNMKIGA